MTSTPPPPEQPTPEQDPTVWTPPPAWGPPSSPPGGPGPLTPPPPPPHRAPWVSRTEARAALVVVAALVLVGVVVGLVWLWWSPPRGIALALGRTTLLPDETEAFVAADGRYAVLTGAVGLVAAVALWCWRVVRGPLVALALAVGCALGAGVTAAVGRLFGGGQTGAATQELVTPPLEVRALGLLALEAAVALLVYGLLVTVSARDDLGVDERGDDERDDDARAPAPLTTGGPERPPD